MLIKRSLLVIELFLVFVIALSLVGCRDEHVHEYEYEEIQPATCQEDGEMQKICKCGDANGESVTLPALGHHYVDGVCVRCQKRQTAFWIEDVKLSIDDQIVEKYVTFVGSEDFSIDVIINNGVVLSDNLPPEITWTFVGDSYGSAITKDGVVSLTKFIGTVTVCVTVNSENEVSVCLPIEVMQGEIIIDSLAVTTNEGYIQRYVEGQIFDSNSITLWGECNDGIVRICDFETDKTLLTLEDSEFFILYNGLVIDIGIEVVHKTLQSIEIVSAPEKTEYKEGELFDSKGLIVKANFEYSSEIITDIELDETTPICLDTESIKIRYTYNGITKTTTQAITVTPKTLVSITVDASLARTLYTQGDSFNTKGIIVKAIFDTQEEIVVEDYAVTSEPLTFGVSYVEISYTFRDVTKTELVDIEVVKPYSIISNVKVLSPSDVSIIWSYTYMTDSGETIVDNTSHIGNGLTYDNVNGIYEIPMGAVVTATIKNPAVINLSLNGVDQNVDYDEKTVVWTMGDASIVVIKSIKMSGDYSVIRFAGHDNECSFLYEGSWGGIISEDDLAHISAIFADTETYYYSYIYGDNIFAFEDIADTIFVKNAEVTVVKNARTVDSKEIVLHIDDVTSYSMYVLSGFSVSDLPTFVKRGFVYRGWSLVEGGEPITAEELLMFLAESKEVYDLYVVWEEELIDYSDKYLHPENASPNLPMGGTSGSTGSTNLGASFNPGSGSVINPPIYSSGGNVKLTGMWEYSFNDGDQGLKCYLEFNDDGSFEYKIFHNEIKIGHYIGTYRLIDEDGYKIEVVSVDLKIESIYDVNSLVPSTSDFSFTIVEESIFANIIIVEEDYIFIIPSARFVRKTDDNIHFDDYYVTLL